MREIPLILCAPDELTDIELSRKLAEVDCYFKCQPQSGNRRKATGEWPPLRPVPDRPRKPEVA